MLCRYLAVRVLTGPVPREYHTRWGCPAPSFGARRPFGRAVVSKTASFPFLSGFSRRRVGRWPPRRAHARRAH
eukprot:2979095-Pleurochrysis_carterae.AAC.1